MYGYIYKFTFLPTHEWYVGKHKYLNGLELDQNYWGSGLKWCHLISQYDEKEWPSLIKREILEWCETRKHLNSREIYWIAELNATNDGLNISPGGDGGDLTINKSSEELKITAEKRSKSQKEAIKKYNEIHEEPWGSWSKNQIWTEESRQKASISAKKRGATCRLKTNNKCIHIVKIDGTEPNKLIIESEYEDYKLNGWISKKDLKEMNKVKKKIGGYNSGTVCLISPDGHRKYVNKSEADKYILIGYSQKEQRGLHNESTKENMRHPHKKMNNTSKVGLGNLTWIYMYDGIEYTGGKLLLYLNSIGYAISASGIEGIINNSQRSCKKYPDLVGKITKYKVGD